MRIRVMFLAMVVAVIACSTVSAGRIIYDDFDGDSTTNLVGTTADIGGVWAGSGNDVIKADGSMTTIGTSIDSTAYQAFTLEEGKVYTLSADVILNSSSANFMSFGFANSVGEGTSPIWDDANPHAWMYLHWQSVRGVKFFIGGDGPGSIGRTGAQKIGNTVLDTTVNLKIELDTTNTSSYTASWFINGVKANWYQGYDTDTSILGKVLLDHVFINVHRNAAGSVDNFELSVVPEPATICLLALGGLTAMMRRRRSD